MHRAYTLYPLPTLTPSARPIPLLLYLDTCCVDDARKRRCLKSLSSCILTLFASFYISPFVFYHAVYRFDQVYRIYTSVPESLSSAEHELMYKLHLETT